MGVIIIIVIFAIVLFIIYKVSELENRATAHLFKGTGFSRADVYGKVAGAMDDTIAKKFLNAHPEYTLESLKELLKNYATQIINRTTIKEFGPKVVEKIQSDSKIDKIATMEFKRANISAANTNLLSGRVIYADNRDEYCLELNITYSEKGFTVERYYIYRGTEIGF